MSLIYGFFPSKAVETPWALTHCFWEIGPVGAGQKEEMGSGRELYPQPLQGYQCGNAKPDPPPSISASLLTLCEWLSPVHMGGSALQLSSTKVSLVFHRPVLCATKSVQIICKMLAICKMLEVEATYTLLVPSRFKLLEDLESHCHYKAFFSLLHLCSLWWHVFHGRCAATASFPVHEERPHLQHRQSLPPLWITLPVLWSPALQPTPSLFPLPIQSFHSDVSTRPWCFSVKCVLRLLHSSPESG